LSGSATLTIDRLGHDGDGVAETADGPVFVPFALPGEVIEAEQTVGRGRLIHVITPSPNRQPPVCVHFGRCGSCALQHVKAEHYRAFKRYVVVGSFKDRGLETEVAEVVPIAPATRRRVVLSAVRGRTGVALGFHAARSTEIVPIHECAVAVQVIVKALPALARLAEPLVSRHGEVRLEVTAAENGLDVSISGVKRGLDGPTRLKVAEAARVGRFLRVTIDGDPLLALGEPVVDFDGIEVALPPGGFLQAAEASEATLWQLVRDATAGAKRVADLFAGLGTFALPLSRSAEVAAVEGDKASLSALAAAHRRTPGLRPIRTIVRDLFREPLSARELDAFDAVVLDPPRQGAKAQAGEIAKSAVPLVVAVSCNPATLARDARILVDGGYRLGLVTPVDQFLFSPHVELVAVLRR
jgi:23S rRNA (uracil1939-C5)-methyltransferase